MGFKDVKKKVIKCLNEGYYGYYTRKGIDIKNLFMCGAISLNEIIELIKCTTGNDYETSPHHADSSIVVHIMKPKNWYIKFYFVDPNTIFISVHEREK
jgi:hypothetical protein